VIEYKPSGDPAAIDSDTVEPELHATVAENPAGPVTEQV
jgi:hypothetical protein